VWLPIIEYLLDPNAVGNAHCSFDVEKSAVIELLKETQKFDISAHRNPEDYRLLEVLEERFSMLEHEGIDDLVDALTHLGIYKPKHPPLGPLSPKLPYDKGMTGGYFRSEAMKYGSNHILDFMIGAFLEENQADFSHINAVHIDHSWMEQILRLDVYSVTDDGIERELDFLNSIPLISKGKQGNVRRHYSSRFAFKAYPGAVAIWAFNRLENPVPERGT
jgi:hypothetical protein